MINSARFSVMAIATVFASTMSLVTISDLAVARSDRNDHGSMADLHKHHKDDRHAEHTRRHHRKKHEKYSVMCIKAPCSRDGVDRHAHRKHSECGKLIVPTADCPTPARDPVGNTHPSLPQEAKQPTNASRKPVLENLKQPGSQSANRPTQAPAAVTVSNGVTTTQIQNGLGGVSVYSSKPGTITVSNGKESTTLSGASVTLSGNVVGVGGGQGVQVGPRNGEGKTVVAIRPEAASAGTLQRNDPRDALKCFGCDVLGGVADFGYGIAHGFAPGSAPPPQTSTTTQQ